MSSLIFQQITTLSSVVEIDQNAPYFEEVLASKHTQCSARSVQLSALTTATKRKAVHKQGSDVQIQRTWFVHTVHALANIQAITYSEKAAAWY